MSRRWFLALVGLAVANVVSPPAVATVVVAKSVEQMTGEAQAVVLARVEGSRSAWDAANQRIYTYTLLRRVESWSGEAPEQLTVRTLGGEVDGIGMKVSGTPRFRQGEEIVVFVRRDPADTASFRVVGLSQGTYRVDRTGTTPMAVSGAEGLAFAPTPNPTRRIAQSSVPSDRPTRLSLSALRSRVEAVREREASGASPEDDEVQ